MNVPAPPTLNPPPLLTDTNDPQVFNTKVSNFLPDFAVVSTYMDVSNNFVYATSQTIDAAAQQVASDLSASNTVLAQINSNGASFVSAAAGFAQDAEASAILAGASIQGTLQQASIGSIATVALSGSDKVLAYAPFQSRVAKTSGPAQSVSIDQTDIHVLRIDEPVVTLSLASFQADALSDSDHCELIIQHEYVDEAIASYLPTGITFPSQQLSQPRTFAFGQKDTRAYILDRSTRTIRQFNIPEGEPISAAVSSQSLTVLNAQATPYDFVRYEPLSKMFLLNVTPYQIFEYNEQVPGDISSCVATQFFSLNLPQTPASMCLSSDGSRFLLADIQGRLFELILNTPGTISNGGQISQIGTLAGPVQAIQFGSDDTEFYVMNDQGMTNYIEHFACPTPGTASGYSAIGQIPLTGVNFHSFAFDHLHKRLVTMQNYANTIIEYETQTGSVVFQPPLDVVLPPLGQSFAYDVISSDRGASFEVLHVSEV